MRKIITCASLVLASVAFADPVDNDGDARFTFYDNPGAPFLHFPSGEDVDSSTPFLTPASEFEAYADSFGNITFNQHTMQFHATNQTVGPMGTPVEVQLFINDITGTINLAGGVSINLTFLAHYRFRAAAAGVTAGNCRTGAFTTTITGSWANTTSASFTPPALTGTGTGACNGYSANVNADFALGSSGARISMYKFSARNISTGVPLTGS